MSAAYKSFKPCSITFTPYERIEVKVGASGASPNEAQNHVTTHYQDHAGEVYCLIQISEDIEGKPFLCGTTVSQTQTHSWILFLIDFTQIQFSNTSAVMNHIKLKHRAEWGWIQKPAVDRNGKRKGGKKTSVRDPRVLIV